MEKDKCCNYVDNCLLATVFVYFKRAGLNIGEYTEDNFWRCLYLAHDQEEDEEELKWELLAWAVGDTWKKNIKAFLIAKDDIWKKMDFRSVVSRKQCEQIMNLSGQSGVWTRFRHKSHSGALRRIGQSDYYPRGPENFTPSYSELCTKCGGVNVVSGLEQVDGDLDEAFFVMDNLDTVSEEDEDTLEMISQQTSEDSDSGLSPVTRTIGTSRYLVRIKLTKTTGPQLSTNIGISSLKRFVCSEARLEKKILSC